MNAIIETERLILRELTEGDDRGMFEMDSDPEVHRFLGNQPIRSIEEAREDIQYVRGQYVRNGIGRWAVVEKSTNTFLGWSGLKLETKPANNHANYYDLGYRFIRKYWGQGFATESAIASVNYGFEHLGLHDIFAYADSRHMASRNVLQKAGLYYVDSFIFEGDRHDWFRMSRADWESSRSKNRL